VVLAGGAAVGLLVLGFEVGKLGSAGPAELVTGLPSMSEPHPATSALAASAHATTCHFLISENATQQFRSPREGAPDRQG
jgi:hypothetical protein